VDAGADDASDDGAADGLDCLVTAFGFADEVEVGVGSQDRGDAVPEDRVVVGDEDRHYASTRAGER
jgi:hypothetical protein